MTRVHRIAGVVALAAALGVAWTRTDFATRDLRLGNDALRRHAIGEALQRYERINPDHPQGGTALFNRGTALFAAGNYTGAEQAFRLALPRLGDEAARAQAYYNLGTALAHQERWSESLEALRQSLLRRQSQAARFNYAWVLARLPQPPPSADKRVDSTQPLDLETRDRVIDTARRLDAGSPRAPTVEQPPRYRSDR